MTAAQVSTDSLAGYWQFNGNALDHSSNRHHGTIYGGAVLTSDRFDTSDAACSFDKTDDWIRIENTAKLDINGTSGLTISAWIKINSFPGSEEYPGILSKWGSSGSTDDQFTLHLRPGGLLAFGLSDTYTFLTSDMAEANVWCLVTGVYDASEHKSRLYINDKVVAMMDIPSDYLIRSTTQFIEIGANSGHFFNGLIDDVRLFSRALDSTEVTALYQHDPYAPPSADTTIGTLESPGLNAAQVSAINPSAGNGIYWLDPDGYGGDAPFQAYCDMTTDGGGWTLVLLSNASVSTCPQPYWDQVVNDMNYKGTLSSDITSFDLFLGVKYWNDLGTQMRLDMGAGPGSLSHRALYDFSLNESNYYALSMSNEQITIHTEGTGSPGMYTYHNGRPLSTRDADHDAYSSSCSNTFNKAAWWYGSCWSGSFWGGGGATSQDAPYWTASGTEYFDYGSIWLKGTWVPEFSSVVTDSITDKTLFSAVIHGRITDYGNTMPTAHGICWNTSGTPVITDKHTDEGEVTATGKFSSAITGLEPNATYYARAYVTNFAGTSYGDELSFTTLADTLPPMVICTDTTIGLNAPGKITIDASFVDDGSSDNYRIDTLYLSRYLFNNSNLGINTIWLYAEDVAGNVDSCSAVVTVIDTISPVAVAGNAMQAPALWNTLRSVSETENSIIGPAGTIAGSVSFDSIVRYGNGITPNTGYAGSGVDFPTTSVNSDSGSIEMWARFYDVPTAFSHGVYGLVNANHWSHNVLSFTWYNPDLLQFLISFNGTGITAQTYGFAPELYSPVHLACVWNKNGINGSGDFMRIYVNDTVVASNSAENTWGSDNSSGDFRVATTWDNNFSTNRYSVENIKVWDYAKTDFLSRSIEITEWDTACFNGYASYDNDGIYDYSWIFNDGISDTVLHGINQQYRFNKFGEHKAVLRVTDSTGNVGTDTLKIKVNVRDLTITASAGSGGQISPAGDSILENRSEIEYTMIPDSGYYVRDITIDDISMTESAQFSAGTACLSFIANNNHVVHSYFDRTVYRWPSVTDIQYGQSLSEASFYNDSTPVQGQFVFEDNGYIPDDTGLHTVNVFFIPDDTLRALKLINTVDITITSADQTISFTAPGDKVCGDADFTLNATASSGLGVEYSCSDTTIISIHENTASINGTGTVLITAKQAGNKYYNAAPEVSQQLTVVSIPFDITEDGASLTVNNSGYSCQWLNCDTDSLIPGETNHVFTAEESGSYAVILTKNTCCDTSSCFIVVISDVAETGNYSNLKVYPNPTKNTVQIQSTEPVLSVSVFTPEGKAVEKIEPDNPYSCTVKLSAYPNGTYIIKIITGKNSLTYRIMKF
ncbi:MAG: T9SS type A sorting domain-containing protein [Bacteroidales bacterium]|nr:T9SS type A sorting domain-containing protein [Bacteroidales bacterium]